MIMKPKPRIQLSCINELLNAIPEKFSIQKIETATESVVVRIKLDLIYLLSDVDFAPTEAEDEP